MARSKFEMLFFATFCFFKAPLPSLLLYVRLCYIVQLGDWLLYYKCWDLNHGCLVSEATALPTAPQPRPITFCFSEGLNRGKILMTIQQNIHVSFHITWGCQSDSSLPPYSSIMVERDSCLPLKYFLLRSLIQHCLLALIIQRRAKFC